MRCVELLAAVALSNGADAPPLHESGLESGLRIVVATTASPAPGAVAPANAPTEVVLAVPVGFANDAARAGSGLATLMADHATQAPEGQATWRAELLPTRTLFSGQFAADALEAALTTLATRLTADGVEEDRFNELMKARAESAKARPAPPSTAIDRFRETAWPTTRFGARPRCTPSDANALTREGLKQFLTQRVGSEGSVLVLVGATPAATLELLAGRALAVLPRARGVAPADEVELYPAKARRVVTPEGSTQALVGFRLAWRADEHGDGLALARAYLESKAGRPAIWCETTPQGACIAFGEDGPGTALHDRLAGAAAALARGAPTREELAAALDRHDAALGEATATPAGLARLLADSAVEWDDPAIAFHRRERLEKTPADALGRELAERLPVSGMIEVLPRGAAGTSKEPSGGS